MVDGMAEIFGTEMVKGKEYQFTPGTKMAVFTYQGCTIHVKGKTEMTYVAKETPMIMYLNAHGGLETLRR
jgi:polyribonucleotide 5'-hydroxyl-kinase